MGLLKEKDELRLLEHAIKLNRWRWAAEEKHLRRAGTADPFTVHLGQIQMMHMIWRELRRDAGLPFRTPPARVDRIARRLSEKKCRAFLRAHPSPDS